MTSVETLGGVSCSCNQSSISAKIEPVGSPTSSMKNTQGSFLSSDYDNLLQEKEERKREKKGDKEEEGFVETLDYDSVVSVSSYGTTSPPSSSVESDEKNCFRVPIGPAPNEKLCDNKFYSTRQVESDEGTSNWCDLRDVKASDERIFDDSNDRFFDCEYNDVTDLDYSSSHLAQPIDSGSKWLQSRMSWSSREDRRNILDRPPAFSYYWRETGPTGVGAGLFNLGNTCFLNAILQCFTHTVPLVKALRSCNHTASCGNEEFCIICVLRDFIEDSLASSGKVVSPWKLVDNLNYISPSFQRYQQEDAHEFLQCLLDRLERCYLDMNSTHEGSSSQEDNIVQQLFGGRLVSKLHCCNCGYSSDKYEPLIDLSLEIEHLDNLQGALESFTKVEKIEDPESKFMCENCKEATPKLKQLKLDQVPSVAILQLKRFKTDGFHIEKIGKHLEFPLELNMKPYTNCCEDDDVDLKYHLYAVVVHRGFSPTSGHYFCFIRSCLDTWHELDDSTVTKFQEEYVLSQAAYILFYAKEGTPWFSSLMGSEKLYLNPGASNSSPKSVLDGLDGDSSSDISGTNNDGRIEGSTLVAADGISANLACETMLAEAQSIETRDEMVGISQKTGENESIVDDPMLDISFPCGSNDCRDGISEKGKLLARSPREENCNEGSRKTERNDELHPTTPIGLNQPNAEVGLAGHRYRIPLDHLKPKNNTHLKRPPVHAFKGGEKREAVRYLNNSMVLTSRSMKLMNAMLPRNDKKRKLGSSSCKRANRPSRCKSIERVSVLR